MVSASFVLGVPLFTCLRFLGGHLAQIWGSVVISWGGADSLASDFLFHKGTFTKFDITYYQLWKYGHPCTLPPSAPHLPITFSNSSE